LIHNLIEELLKDIALGEPLMPASWKSRMIQNLSARFKPTTTDIPCASEPLYISAL